VKIVCGDCGGFYVKVKHFFHRYGNDFFHKCGKQNFPSVVRSFFSAMVSKLMGDREELISNCRLSQSILCDCSEIDAELEGLGREIEVVTELSKEAIYENVRVAVSQEEWNERNNSYLERHRKATERIAELEKLKCERQNKSLMLATFIKGIESRPLVLEEFDDKLWAVAVEKAKVMPDGRLVFRF